MGKSKDDTKLKRSPSSGDEGRSKKRKSKDDDEYKSSKKHKSHKSSARHSDKAKKSERRHKDKHRKHKSSSNVQELSSDDYFSKNNEFAMWLKEERKLFFSDLSSESARELFSEFVAEWNNQELDPQYYEGVAAGPRSSHKWNIKK